MTTAFDSTTLEEISAKLSVTQKGVTGVRICQCDWTEAIDICSSIMGGVTMDGGIYNRLPANTWPGIDFLFVDSIDIDPVAEAGIVDNDWTFEKGIQFKLAQLTIKYNTGGDSSDSNKGNNQPQSEAFLTQSVDYSCELLTVPHKIKTTASVSVVDATGVASLSTQTTTRIIKKHIRIPSITFTCERSWVINPPWDAIRNNSGKINDVKVMGGDVGTVLFDGPKATQEIKTMIGIYCWKLTYKLIYQRHGWNNTIHPDTFEWVPCTAPAKDGSSDDEKVPYETGDFNSILMIN